MKLNHIYRIFIALVLCNLTLPASAQRVYTGQINITQAEARQQAELVLVSMQIDLSNLKVDNQRSLTLTPVLANSNNRVELPPIIINGGARQKAYIRAMALDPRNPGNYQDNVVLQSGKGENQVLIDYNQTVAFQSWMNNASVYLKEDLCGCGGHSEQSGEELILKEIIREIPPAPEPKPIEVSKSVSKVRNETKTITIYFPIGHGVIKDGYMDNQAQLEQIDKVLKEIKSNKNINITSIEIEGYSSPDGGAKRNEQLSRQRGQSLKEYLLKNVDLPLDKYNIVYGGEDWAGLISMIEASSIDYKEDILSIIKNTQDINLRKKKLEELAGGRPYAQMFSEFYPLLRKAICNIHIHYSITDTGL